jgi:hypothetical protein
MDADYYYCCRYCRCRFCRRFCRWCCFYYYYYYYYCQRRKMFQSITPNSSEEALHSTMVKKEKSEGKNMGVEAAPAAKEEMCLNLARDTFIAAPKSRTRENTSHMCGSGGSNKYEMGGSTSNSKIISSTTRGGKGRESDSGKESKCGVNHN